MYIYSSYSYNNILILIYLVFRVEKISLCYFFTIWANPGNNRPQNPEDEGPGFCGVPGNPECHHSVACDARLPFLRQTHGEINIINTIIDNND